MIVKYLYAHFIFSSTMSQRLRMISNFLPQEENQSENTNEETRISISDACVTDCTANFTVAGISDKVNSLSENMLEPIQSTEVDSDSFFKIPAVSLKVVSDIQKDLSIPKNASLGARRV